MKHLPAPPGPLPYLMGVSSLYKPTSLSAFILVSVIFKIVSPLYVNQKSCDLHQWIALVSPFPTSATCLGTALRLGQHMHINETPPRPSPSSPLLHGGYQVYISRPRFPPSFSSRMLKRSLRVIAIASFVCCELQNIVSFRCIMKFYSRFEASLQIFQHRVVGK